MWGQGRLEEEGGATSRFSLVLTGPHWSSLVLTILVRRAGILRRPLNTFSILGKVGLVSEVVVVSRRLAAPPDLTLSSWGNFFTFTPGGA